MSCQYHKVCDGHGIGGFEPTKTKQSFKEECDINEILKRARNGQDISGSLNARIAQYGDVTKIPDFQSALNVVVQAESMFMELSADLREKFENDPAKFLNFVQDDKNRAEAEKLGLIAPKPAQAVTPAVPGAPGASPGATPAANAGAK